MSKNSKSLETESKLVVISGWSWKGELTTHGCEELFQCDENVIKLYYGVGCTTQ